MLLRVVTLACRFTGRPTGTVGMAAIDTDWMESEEEMVQIVQNRIQPMLTQYFNQSRGDTLSTSIISSHTHFILSWVPVGVADVFS